MAPRHAAASETTITAYPDGPLLLRGPAVIVDESGQEVQRRPGPVALCRCGKSSLAPFCDGTHKALTRSARRRPADAGQSGPTRAEPRPATR